MKKKKYLNRIITMVLMVCLMLGITPMQTYATEQGDYFGGSQTQEEVTGPVQQGGRFDFFIKQSDLGLRLYVTDEEGQLYPTDINSYARGADVVDFLYVPSYGTRKVATNLRSVATVYARSSYSTFPTDITELGFQDYKEFCTHTSDCPCKTEYFVDVIRHRVRGPLSENILKMKLYSKTEGEQSVAENILDTYWSNVAEIVRNQDPNSANVKKFYLNVEILVNITHHTTNPNNPVWYGSVFEMGCLSQAAYNRYTTPAKGYYDMKVDYQRRLANAFGIFSINDVPETYQDTNLFPYLQIAETGDVYRSLSQIKNQAYGINIISFDRIIRPNIETEKSEIPTDELEIKKDTSTTITKVEYIDNVEIRTGYGAQYGYYDIGVDAGIPTTEEIRNVIEAQDCIISYGYVLDKYVPTEFPKVTYNLTYYYPCDVKTYDSEETDYDSPIYNTDPLTGEDYIADYETKTVTHEYCGYLYME